MGGTDGQTIPPQVHEQINGQAAAFAQISISQYMQQQQPANPYAQIVSNLAHVKEAAAAAPPEPQAGPAAEPAEEAKPARGVVALVHYSSESDDGGDAAVEAPPDETRLVIEKMASYVAKNGADFEEIVRSKGDARFDFLLEDHAYHRFYEAKIAEFGGGAAKADETKEEGRGCANGIPANKAKDKKVIAPVSFSIKKPKEETAKDIKSALPLEESDDDDGDDFDPDAQPQPAEAPAPAPAVRSPPDAAEERDDDDAAPAAADDPILEMIDLTDDLEERKDARRAEDKIKDKLAAAARERMVLVAKDRALQLERRKKAAAFLRLKAAAQPDGEDRGATAADEARPKGRRGERAARRDESESAEEGEIKRRKGKKKKSYRRKRKRSRSRKRSGERHKKAKKKRRRSESCSSTSSKD